MSKQKIFLSFLALTLLVVLLAVFIFWLEKYEKTTMVTFLDVGEGDAILISQGQNQILIDGGRSGKELLAHMGRHMPFWDRRVEIIIATHPDADHIGGFVGLLGAYRVGQFLYTGAQSKTETFTLLQKALTTSTLEPQKIFRGSSIKLPRGGELAIEYPLSALPTETAETNTGSIVSRFTYGVTEILFTGDLPNEETVLPEIRTADILKVAHHGSRYSTSVTFLDRLQPKEAIISVGKNTYGHPSPDVIRRLRERDIIVHQTDREGDIRYRCTEELSRCVFVY